MASEHESSVAWREKLRIQPGGHERADLHAEMPPGIVITTYENITDEYYKADLSAPTPMTGPPKSKGVEQVPVALTVPGPISLRRVGIYDNAGSPSAPQSWSTEPYKVIVGKKNTG